MRLDPSQTPIVVGAIPSEVFFVAVDGIEIPQSDYSVNGSIVTLRDGREFSLTDLPTGVK